MASVLNDKEKIFLKRILKHLGLLRFLALGMIILAILLEGLMLVNPGLVLVDVLAGPHAQRVQLEQYFNSLHPNTELEKELLTANIHWNNFVWNFFLLTNVRIASMFAAYLLSAGILVLFFAGILQRLKEFVYKMEQGG